MESALRSSLRDFVWHVPVGLSLSKGGLWGTSGVRCSCNTGFVGIGS